jgi:hypothetical protein
MINAFYPAHIYMSSLCKLSISEQQRFSSKSLHFECHTNTRQFAERKRLLRITKAYNLQRQLWPCGPMDKASDYESGDSRFESWQGRIDNALALIYCYMYVVARYGSYLEVLEVVMYENVL